MRELSVVIPAYNEEDTIASILNKVGEVNLEGLEIEKEIIVVDDGSRDKTAEIVKKYFPQVILIRNSKKEGKGSAIRKALEHLGGDLVVVQDADLEYDPEEYPHLLEPIVKGKAEVVYGSRFLSSRYPPGMLFLNYLGNIAGTFIVNLLYGAKISDLMTGHKVLPRKLFLDISLTSRGFDICPEITAKLLKKGVEIYEVPISYRGRREGKKIKVIDSLFILFTLIKLRFKN